MEQPTSPLDVSRAKGMTGEGLPAARRPNFQRCKANKLPSGTESIGYEVNESEQFLDYLHRNFQHTGLKNVIRWAIMVGIGLGTGLVAVSVDVSIELLCELRSQLNDGAAESLKTQRGGVFLQFLAFLAFRASMAMVAGVLVCFVETLAAGSGIPEIKCYLNGVCLKRVVGLRALVAKAVGIVFSVAAALPVGKEGPMIHSGAIIGALFTKLNLRRHIRPFSLDVEKRDMVAAGAASGVSAAFGAPMGSVLFAIEEGTSHMNPAIMMRLFVACSAAALVSRVFYGLHGHLMFGQLGTKVPVSFGKFFNMDYDLRELGLFIILGMLGGAAGSLFNSANKKLTQWRQRHVPGRGWKRLLEVLLVDALVVSVLFWIPICLTGGEPRTSEELSPTLRLFWQTGTSSMKALFHDERPFDEGSLLVFALVNFELSCLVYGLGVPSGLFVPSLLTGAAYGRLFGQCVHRLVDDEGWADAGVYALIGAVANLSGTARITISLAAILMESTGNAQFSLPIFLVVMVARWTGNFLRCSTDKGIYDMHIIELKHVPLLEQSPPKREHAVPVSEVMATPPVCFQVVESVESLLSTLESCTHNGFPVLQAGGSRRLLGTIRRSILERLLEKGAGHGLLQPPSTGPLLRRSPLLSFEECWMPGRFESYQELRENLTAASLLQHLLDLGPYVNKSGYSMPSTASVASTFNLFRKLGLRHLPIVDERGELCGIVTRKDLILEEEEERRPKLALEEVDSAEEEEQDDSAAETQSDASSVEASSTPGRARSRLLLEGSFFGGGGF